MDKPEFDKLTDEQKAEQIAKWKAAAEAHKEEIEDWMKYIRDLKFDNLEDLCEFAYAWTNYYDNPGDPVAAMKFTTLAREYFPSFLREVRNQVKMQARISKILKAKMESGELDLNDPESLNLSLTEEDLEKMTEPEEKKETKGSYSFSEQFLGKKSKRLN